MANIFPRHDIDPNKKDEKWGLQAAKAIDDEQKGSTGIFHKNKAEYDIIRTYVIGEQDTKPYKILLLGADKCNDEESLLAIDWRPRPIGAKLRSILVSKILERGYNFGCYPIDPLAKDEMEAYFKDLEIKMMMRKAALEVNPELARNPAFMKEHGEPGDMEELEITKTYGPKMKLAMDAEMGIQLVMYQNNYEEICRVNAENLVDFGVAGIVDYIDENWDVRVREIDIDSAAVSPCKKADFSDKTYWAEYREVPLSQLASKFTKEELQIISEQAVNKRDSPVVTSEFNEEFDSFKATVLEFEILSWNDMVYQQRVDKRGNLVVRKEEFIDKSKTSGKLVEYKGEQIPQFKRKTREVLYTGKWVVGTDYIYDFGLATNVKRSKPNRAQTEMSANFSAYDYAKGKALSMMMRLIPLIDEYMMTIYKIQNFKNKWVPYIIDIDYEALEGVAIGAKNQVLTPKDLLDMVFQNFTLVSKRTDVAGQNVNYKPVDIRATGMAQEYQVLAGDLVRVLGDMRDMIGLNEVTDGSSPNPNMLNYVASLGASATNNALRPLITANRKLGEAAARGIIRRLIHVVKKKRVEGLLPALGSETLKFFSLTPDIQAHDWGIMVEDRPTPQEREGFLQNLNLKNAQGQISPDDYVLILNTPNLKQAAALLAQRIKAREKEAREYELQKMQMNGQVQTQSGLAVEKAKQETLTLEYKLKTDLELAKKNAEMELLKMKLDAERDNKETEVAGKIATQGLANQGKNQPAPKSNKN